jgi:protein TonB
MAHELLGDVLRTPDAGGRARRRYLLPLSIAVHGAAAAAVLIIPLAAEVQLPEPARLTSRYVNAMPVVVPPAPPPPGRPAIPRTTNRGAPLQAPETIEPEKAIPVEPGYDAGPPAMGAIGSPDGVDVGDLISTTRMSVAPPPPPPVREPLPVGGRIREPKKIVDVAPIYPPFAVVAKKEGVVIVQAVIDERGNVVRVKVLRSEPLLDDAAVSAVQRWRYTPTLLNNVPVPVLMTITVRFSLR